LYRNHIDLGIFLTGTIWTWECFWQEPYGPGSLVDRNLLAGTLWPRTYISRNLFGRNLFGRNLSVGTFGSLEPFSQDLFLQERFGRNLLVGTFRQEPIVIPPERRRLEGASAP
jgi:hypothetical protein